MSAKVKTPTMGETAEQASFQLACAKSFADWIASVVHAIQLDIKHNKGHNAAGLIELAQYLADRNQADIGHACAEVDAAIEAAGGAQ
ncbi:MAG: hypothetical protein ACRER8_22180 [Pseudomonas sp.]|uniref:hypothetical protein n=1 Tax=Pseudomonas sp. TaxID=306 RepID=UPI003D6F5C2E